MSKRTLQRLAHELSVTSFLDYRDYLAELYAKAKAALEPYSYLLFAEHLGFAQTNVIRLVVSRKRTLALKSAKTVAESLELRKEDRKYFLAMVQYANARSAKLRHEFFREMLEVKQASVTEDSDKRRMSYFADWYHPVVREMQRLGSYRADPEWIAANLYTDINAEKVRRSLALLQELGMTPDEPIVLPTDATAGELSIAQYHQAMIELARQAVTEVPAKRREVNAMTLALSMSSFKELRRRIRDFCAQAMTLENEGQPRECVAQVNLQLFTLTKPSEDEERGTQE